MQEGVLMFRLQCDCAIGPVKTMRGCRMERDRMVDGQVMLSIAEKYALICLVLRLRHIHGDLVLHITLAFRHVRATTNTRQCNFS